MNDIMQAQAEAAIKDFFGGPPGEKLKTAATAQLTLALLTTFWVPSLSGALAVLGLLSVSLSNSEFLRLVRVRWVRTLLSCCQGFASRHALHSGPGKSWGSCLLPVMCGRKCPGTPRDVLRGGGHSGYSVRSCAYRPVVTRQSLSFLRGCAPTDTKTTPPCAVFLPVSRGHPRQRPQVGPVGAADRLQPSAPATAARLHC